MGVGVLVASGTPVGVGVLAGKWAVALQAEVSGVAGTRPGAVWGVGKQVGEARPAVVLGTRGKPHEGAGAGAGAGVVLGALEGTLPEVVLGAPVDTLPEVVSGALVGTPPEVSGAQVGTPPEVV